MWEGRGGEGGMRSGKVSVGRISEIQVDLYHCEALWLRRAPCSRALEEQNWDIGLKVRVPAFS